MKKATILLPILLATAILSLQACKNSEENHPVPVFETMDLSGAWNTDGLAEQYLDRGLIQSAITEASAIPRMRSLLIVRNGKLVSENYFADASQSHLHDVRSVTKSIVAILTSIAVEKGHLSSLDKPIDLGENYTLSEDQQAITFRHLLEMKSGIQWNEWTSTSYNDWIVSNEHIQSVLDLPMAHEPGTTYTYNSGSTHLLGKALSVEVGMSLEDYADQELFDHLNVSTKQWEMLSTGANGGAGIDLRARDLAKIGQLLLQDGFDGQEQLVSRSSVQAMTGTTTAMGSFGPLSGLTYGQLWWTANSPHAAYFAWGYGGQFIVVSEELKMVVVATTYWPWVSQEDGGASALEQKVLDIIFEKVLEAAR